MLNANKIKKTPKIIAIIISVVVTSLTSVTVFGDTSSEANITNVVDSLEDTSNDANHVLDINEDSVETLEMVQQKSLPVENFSEINGDSQSTLDFITDASESVKAIGDGEVIFVGYVGSKGYQVRIKQDDGYIAIYSHLSVDTPVELGDMVLSGEIFAMTGTTGNTVDMKCGISLIETEKYNVSGTKLVLNDQYNTDEQLVLSEIKSYFGI